MSTPAGIKVNGMWYYASADGYPDDIVPVLEEIFGEFQGIELKDLQSPDGGRRINYLGFILHGLMAEQFEVIGEATWGKDFESCYDYEVDEGFNIKIYEWDLDGRKEINYNEYLKEE